MGYRHSYARLARSYSEYWTPVIIQSAFTSSVQILTGEFLLGDPDRW